MKMKKNGFLCCLQKKYIDKKKKNKQKPVHRKSECYFLQACIQIWPNHWVAGERVRGGEKIKTKIKKKKEENNEYP